MTVDPVPVRVRGVLLQRQRQPQERLRPRWEFLDFHLDRRRELNSRELVCRLVDCFRLVVSQWDERVVKLPLAPLKQPQREAAMVRLAAVLDFRRPAAKDFQSLAEDFQRPVQVAQQRGEGFRQVAVPGLVRQPVRPERRRRRYWLLQTQTPGSACG